MDDNLRRPEGVDAENVVMIKSALWTLTILGLILVVVGAVVIATTGGWGFALVCAGLAGFLAGFIVLMRRRSRVRRHAP